MLHLILVRHGETEWNKQHRYQGQVDVPLSDVGKQQAKLLAKRLSSRNIDVIYASDLKRAWDTASVIAANNSWTVLPEPRLREMNFGILEGLTFDKAQAQYPEMVTAWLENYNQPSKGGESLDVFSARVLSFRDDLQEKHYDQTILLVAHGGPLSELLRITLDVPTEKRWAFALDNASISELILGDEGYPSLKRLNDTCHLKTNKREE